MEQQSFFLFYSVWEHCGIINYFNTNFPHKDEGWMYFGYMLLLEKSQHLKDLYDNQINGL